MPINSIGLICLRELYFIIIIIVIIIIIIIIIYYYYYYFFFFWGGGGGALKCISHLKFMYNILPKKCSSVFQ